MTDEKDKVLNFILNENAFQVMGEFKRLGLLTKEDMTKAMTMDREGWINFMKQKAGLLDDDEE